MWSRLLLATAGAALLVAAVLLVVGDDEPEDVGAFDLAASSSPADRTPEPTPAVPSPSPSPTATPASPASATPVEATSPTPAPRPTPAVPEIGVRSARITDLATSERAAAPSRLRLPRLDLDLPVVPVGVADDGQMEIPEDVDEAGWYRFGPRPGEPGHAVVAGHVDDRVQGLGAFRRLVELTEGDEVVVEADDGTTSTWRVSARRTIDKAALEADDLFTRTGEPRLVLVTCGGEFDADARSYRSNVVVVADLL